MPTTPSAFIFDMNGTMIDDMEYHIVAWSDILNNDLKAGLDRDAVKREMYGRNDEVLVRIFGKNRFSQSEMDRLSMEKEIRYQRAYLAKLCLISGLSAFLDLTVANHIPMAIGSAAIPFNIDFILDNLNLRHYFTSVVSANDVEISKPHPETFLRAAKQLNVEPGDCIVFEDAPKGVEAAFNAGMKAIVLTTLHSEQDFAQHTNVLLFINDYNDPRLSQLFRATEDQG